MDVHISANSDTTNYSIGKFVLGTVFVRSALSPHRDEVITDLILPNMENNIFVVESLKNTSI